MKTYLYISTLIPLVLPVVIERELIGPTIVGLPGIVAALKDEVRRAITRAALSTSARTKSNFLSVDRRHGTGC